ncbi:MAG: thiamine phosphate synthase [Devosia sp.]|nr:thiamine phosphate synthase [Devosia sp.]
MTPQLYLITPPDAEPAALAALLQQILVTADISAVLLRRGARTEAVYLAFVDEIAPIGQAAGCAVLIEGNDPKLAMALGVDGVHVDGSVAAVKAALAALKPNLIVGVGGVASRHEAMSKGEQGVDYIMFGPLSGAIAPDVRELAGWWAETMEIPSVLSDPEATPASADAGGCEFLALSDSIWRADDPVAAIAAIAEGLDATR